MTRIPFKWLAVTLCTLQPLLLVTHVLASPAFPDAGVGEPSAGQLVSPVRRVGALPVQHNVPDFLKRMETQSSELRGFVASPLQGEALEWRLWQVLEQASRASGRFWLVRPDGARSGSFASDTLQAAVTEWQLDAWVSPQIEFFPDYTRLSLSLMSVAGGRVLGMQSTEIKAMAGESSIYSGFLALWARLGQALGHLSAISWQSGDLVTIDIGSPQLHPGDELLAGEVFVTRRHPRDGEVLDVSQKPLAVLNVVEVAPSSSLARVAKISDDRADKSLEGLLVWLPGQQLPSAGRVGRSPTDVALYGEQVDQGFDFRDDAVEKRPPLALPPIESVASITAPEAQSSSNLPGKQNISSDPGAEPSATIEEATPADVTVQDRSPLSDQSWSEALSDPAHWRREPVTAYTGQSWGVFDTAPCENEPCSRFTGFPRTLVNLVGATLRFRLTPNAGLTFDGRFANYVSGDVEGYELAVRALSVHEMSRSGSGSGRFSLGFGPELKIGKVETVLVERSLLGLAVRVSGIYEVLLSWGALNVRADVSAIDLLGGRLNVDTRFVGRNIHGLPQPLELFVGLNRASKSWLQFELGAGWRFDPSY